MSKATLPERLRAGQLVFGTAILSPSTRWPDAVAKCGLDFVFIDTEHVAVDRAQVSWMCQTYSRMGLPPIVRIPAPDPYQATMALDGGAGGVVAPYVETVEQVQAMRGAVKLRPVKGTYLQEILSGGRMPKELGDYLAPRGAAKAMIVNIESIPAIRNLDAILAVPDLDAVLIGPHDLSCSLGIPEQYTHPKFREAAGTILKKARAAGVGAGIHFWGSHEENRWFIDAGANMFIYSSDLRIFTEHLERDVARLKGAGSKGVEDEAI